MKLYLSYKSIPELAELDEKTAAQLWRKSLFKSMRHCQVWIIAIIDAIFVTSPMIFMLAKGWNFWLAVLVLSILAYIGLIISTPLMLPYMRPYMHE